MPTGAMEDGISKIIADTIEELFDMLGKGEVRYSATIIETVCFSPTGEHQTSEDYCESEAKYLNNFPPYISLLLPRPVRQNATSTRS